MKYFIHAAILLIALPFGTYAKDNATDEPEPTREEVLAIKDNDIVIGEKDAPFTIIEYASLTCSHCASFHNNTFSQLKEKYIDTGKAKFIFRDFPLDEPALRASMFARCTSNEKTHKFLDVMFSTQSNWAQKENYLEVLSNIGKLGGMKSEEFDACVENEELERSIMKSRFHASKYLEVRSTPTFFINGEIHQGARDIDYFTKIIEGK